MGSDTGRRGKAYEDACAVVRERALRGEPCFFYGKQGHDTCPGTFDWGLSHRHRWSFTTHHIVRIMDGGDPVPDPYYMRPAHRSCNARDGMYAQNARRTARRRGMPYVPTPVVPVPTTTTMRTSREW